MLTEELKAYYGQNLLGFIVYELYEKGIIGFLLVLRKRSPLMIDDSIRALQFVRYYYPDARSVSVITLKELKEKIEERNPQIIEFVRNIVYIYDEEGSIKKLIEKVGEE